MKRAIFCTSILLSLTACGGGDSSPQTSSAQESLPIVQITNVSVKANFIKGPVNGGTCELFAIDNGQKSTIIAQAITDQTGLADFGANIPAQGNALIECIGGNYIDEFTEQRAAQPAPLMRTVVNIEGNNGDVFHFAVTPLTEISTLMALSNSQGLDSAINDNYNSAVALAFGIDEGANISTLLPVDLLNTIVTQDSLQAQYGYALALYSYLTENIQNTQWTQTLADDLRQQLAVNESLFSQTNREHFGAATQHYLGFGSLINSALQDVNIRHSVEAKAAFILPVDDTPIKTLSLIKPIETVRAELVAYITSQNLTPLADAPAVSDAMFNLGQSLAFDKLLSGNRDTSCMTCHHPNLASGDQRSLSLGTGASGLGQQRTGGEVIARHAQPLFNLDLFKTLFWDGRIALNNDNSLSTPADATGDLTAAMEAVFFASRQTQGFQGYGLVAAQAMFPVTDAHEMRGAPSATNELAQFTNNDFTEIWSALMTRLGEIPAYIALFEAAYPNIDFKDMTFAHAANAIAAFEISAFNFRNNPWQAVINDVTSDGVLDNPQQLDENTTRGAHFFFETGCVNCHKGAVMSDFDFHNLAFAQYGPGKGNGLSGFEDFGRENITNRPQDRSKFRTAPLFNIDLTAPYAHLGQFNNLWSHIQTYAIPERFWINLYTGYDRVIGGFVHTPLFNDEISEAEQTRFKLFDVPSFDDTNYGFIRTLEYIETKLAQAEADPGRVTIEEGKRLGDGEQRLQRQILVPFMEAQTDPRARNLSHIIPTAVASGLTVER